MLQAQGLKPKFVLAFRGPASFYVSTDRNLIPLDKQDVADQIASKVKEMSGQDGVRFEQCSVATGALKINNDTILHEVNVVGNSWISLVGYQNRGYAYVQVD